MSYPELTDAITESNADRTLPDYCSNEDADKEKGLNEETVKRWAAHIVPKCPDLIENFLRDHSLSREIADAWWQAIDAAWRREKIDLELERAEESERRSAVLKLVKELRARVLADTRLTRLPALFETDQPLPLATAYVELCVAPARPYRPSLCVLAETPTLVERIKDRAKQRDKVRRAPHELLDREGAGGRLIVGAPGTGKSSLMRRLALDIAGGAWTSASLPLFVEARAFALRLRHNPTLSLIDYACEQVAGTLKDADLIRLLLTSGDVEPDKRDKSDKRVQRAILLVDGLDEIASDNEAVRAVYGELSNRGYRMSWIATARPAGIVGDLGAIERFEMAELDAQSIDALIRNWCAANAEAGLMLDADALQAELGLVPGMNDQLPGMTERVPGIREMATNPFLLTALCFLKSTSPDQPLPNSRIAVYETLLERIAHQAQARRLDPSILSQQAVQDLSEFALFLYQHPEGAVQIFRILSWREFVAERAKNSDNVATDFIRQIVPARLLAVWGEVDPQYHFLHLTLQEYLVAQAMLGWKVSEVLKYRFFPVWRSVFRFYGALLWQRRRHREFSELTQVLFETRDINGLSLVTLAQIFADSGLSDTTKQLGADLREVILGAIRADHPEAMDEFIYALSALDPEWLTERTLRDLSALSQVAFEAARRRQELAPKGQESYFLMLLGRDYGSPYLRLARARMKRGLDAIEAAFWGHEQKSALLAAFAYAEVATPEQLARVVDLAHGVDILDKMALRVYAFAQAKGAHEFLPFLDRFTQAYVEKAAPYFSQAMSLVATIGGEGARKIFEARLIEELKRLDGDDNQIDTCIRTATQLGGAHAAAIFRSASQNVVDGFWKDRMQCALDVNETNCGGLFVEKLDDYDFADTVLLAVADWVAADRLPAPAVLDAIKEFANEVGPEEASDLAELEQRMLEANMPLGSGPRLVDLAAANVAYLRDPEFGAEARQSAINSAMKVLEVLGELREPAARGLGLGILDGENLPGELKEGAVEMLGRIMEGTGDHEVVHRLEQMLYDDSCGVDALSVTVALGRVDLDRLFLRRGAWTAASALQQIAAEMDYLIFDEFWVDRQGRLCEFKVMPKRVLYAANPQQKDLVEVVAHEFSASGLYLSPECPPKHAKQPLECSKALLIFEPLDNEMLNDAHRRMLKEGGALVVHIPADADDDAQRLLARTLGPAIARLK